MAPKPTNSPLIFGENNPASSVKKNLYINILYIYIYPSYQPCWGSCSSNLERKSSILNAYSSLLLHQMMDQANDHISSYPMNCDVFLSVSSSAPNQDICPATGRNYIPINWCWRQPVQCNGQMEINTAPQQAQPGRAMACLLKRQSLLGQISPWLCFELSLATPKCKMSKLHQDKPSKNYTEKQTKRKNTKKHLWFLWGDLIRLLTYFWGSILGFGPETWRCFFYPKNKTDEVDRIWAPWVGKDTFEMKIT